MGLGTREKRERMFTQARKHCLSRFLIVLTLLGRCPAALPPIPQTEARVAEAVPVEHPPKLDGTLGIKFQTVHPSKE